MIRSSKLNRLPGAARKSARQALTATLGILMLTVAVLPTRSLAQSCSQWRSELSVNKSQMARIFFDNPGSTIVWGMCASSAVDEYQRTFDAGSATAKYATCAALACAFTDSYGNCVAVQAGLFSQALKIAETEVRIKERC